ncbi:MAG: hypothetical protein GY771_01845 [bacterium]|nr:hypothetical protein [bacterium]
MDARDKVEMDRSGIKDFLMKIIPGYAGYVEKETRREADKLLRMHLADKLEVEKKKAQGVRGKMVDDGIIKLLDDIDRIDLIFENLVDSLRFSSYGYAGFFDAVKVKEDALDRLYDFDASLAQDIEAVAAKVEEVKAEYGGDLKPKLDELKDMLKEFEAKLEQRQNVIAEVS